MSEGKAGWRIVSAEFGRGLASRGATVLPRPNIRFVMDSFLAAGQDAAIETGDEIPLCAKVFADEGGRIPGAKSISSVVREVKYAVLVKLVPADKE